MARWTEMESMSDPNQFDLLRERRFAPYFLTQLLGAFNDNVYKNALVALIAFAAISGDEQNSGLLINLAAGLFILPFFLFSAFCGQLADKYEKSMLLRRIKLAEIGIMIAGAMALGLGNVYLLLVVLFLMGTQSAFFGPIKYSILPQHLSDSELVGGNGLVELGTFLAILIGTIAGTQLIDKAAGSVVPASVVIIVVAVLGYCTSRWIPAAVPSDPMLSIRFNPVSETWQLYTTTKKHRVIFQSILGISWFWFLGATYLAQFPVYSRDVLGGGVDLFTLLLAMFSVGIGVGSGLCERLSKGRVEIGLVPFGAIGLTLFGLDLFWATPGAPFGTDLGIATFLQVPGAKRVAFDVFMIGLFGGLYIVPLHALIQDISAPDRLSRVIAFNNVMNAILMVLSAVIALILLALGTSIAGIFLAMALMNALVAIYIFRLVPEFLMRFVVWLLVHTLYRVQESGLQNIPGHGAVVLAVNHVSFVDALIIAGCIRRPVRFVMHHSIYALPLLNFVFRTAGAIPIADRNENAELYDRAFEKMRTAIEAGDVLCIFPEGQITHDGQLNAFRPGIQTLLDTHPVPVIPMALLGLWGSLFSRKNGPAFFKLPRRLFARIGLACGEPIAPADVTPEMLRARIVELRGDRL